MGTIPLGSAAHLAFAFRAKIKELEVDDARSYQVQRVIGMRHKKRVRDFLIKWTGYEE